MNFSARLISKRAMFLISVFIVTSCASSSKEIATAYVSPEQYSSFSCDQLSQEVSRLNIRKTQLAADLDKKASSDDGLTAVSAILFWPAAFALGGNQAQEAEYGRLKGEFDAVQQAAVKKNCSINSTAVKVASATTSSTSTAGTNTDSVSVFDFYGQAEEEITSNTYDKNLWAIALVEAEGDETKRKAKYIKLRATQLHGANIREPLSAQPAFAVPGLTGIYKAVITGASDISSDFRNPNLEVEMVRKGNQITGNFSRKGRVWGDIEGNKIKFNWIVSGGFSGEGNWVIDSANNTLNGVWSYGNSKDQEWNMTRVR